MSALPDVRVLHKQAKARVKADPHAPIEWTEERMKAMSAPPVPSKRMAWARSRVKVLRDLVAAAPAATPSELAKQFNDATRGFRVDARKVAEACDYYGIQRAQGGKPKPEPWSNWQVGMLRHWLGEVKNPSKEALTRRIREITGRDLAIADIPPAVVQRVRSLRRFLVVHGLYTAGTGKLAPQAQRELAAREAMVSWLDRDQLVKAVGPIVRKAITWCSRPPGQEDPDELVVYQSEVPESWWDPEVFLDNVLRGLEEELHRQFEEAGMPERRDEMMAKISALYDAEYGSGSLFDSLPSGSTTDTHAVKPAGLQQDRPVIAAGS